MRGGRDGKAAGGSPAGLGTPPRTPARRAWPPPWRERTSCQVCRGVGPPPGEPATGVAGSGVGKGARARSGWDLMVRPGVTPQVDKKAAKKQKKEKKLEKKEEKDQNDEKEKKETKEEKKDKKEEKDENDGKEQKEI